MDVEEPVYAVKEWRRLGRGRGLDFYATDDEVQRWLIEGLPAHSAPYTLVTIKTTGYRETYLEQGVEFGIEELKKAMYELDKVRWQYWIRSKMITPELELSPNRRLTWVLSFSGLVELQHGLYNKNRWVEGRDASSIGIVDRVINDATGAMIEHKGYLKIFNALRKRVKKDLCYSSFWKYKDGSELEEFKLRLMTEGAVRAYEEGMKFVNRPGRRLK